jgi:protein TonB
MKRRTSVAVSLEEESRAKAAAPKPRKKVQDPMPSYQTKPSYPAPALKDSAEGFVRARFLVSVTGMVSDFQTKLSQPPGVFDQAVKEAVEQWRFAPARDQDGKPMDEWMEYNFQFRLQESGS